MNAYTANRGYLDARVCTASQPELQLMLLDGALRFAGQARQAWGDELRRPESDRALRRALDVVEELVHSVSGGRSAESARLEDEYAYIYRSLTAAQLDHDAVKLDDAVKLLLFHRDTWRLACEKLRSQPAPAPRLVDLPNAASGFSCQA